MTQKKLSLDKKGWLLQLFSRIQVLQQTSVICYRLKLASLIKLTPLFAGFLVVKNQALVLSDTKRLIAFTYFFLCVLVWAGLKKLIVLRSNLGPKLTTRFNLGLIYAGLGISILVSLACLQGVRERLGEELFLAILFGLGLIGLSEAAWQKNKFSWALALELGQYACLGTLSILILSGHTNWANGWPGAVFGLGLACMIILPSFARALMASKPGEIGELARSLAMCMLAGPTFLGTLAYTGLLPRYYLVLFIPAWLGLRELQKLQKSSDFRSLAPSFARNLTGLAWLFVVFTILLSLL